jgi:hypothetical protein
MRKITNWFRSNKIAINTAKTKYMILRTRGKQINETNANLCIILQKLASPLTLTWYRPLNECITQAMKKLLKASECILMNI